MFNLFTPLKNTEDNKLITTLERHEKYVDHVDIEQLKQQFMEAYLKKSPITDNQKIPVDANSITLTRCKKNRKK